MSATRFIHILLKAQPKKLPFFLAVMQAISASMLAHATTFAGSPVDLTMFKTQVGNLASAQQAARVRGPGLVAARTEALQIVSGSVELLRAFVEQLCNSSPEQAATIAQAASMQIRTTALRAKVPLRARQGDQSGVVILYASVALLVTGKGGRYFNWEYSLDGGKTWITVASTPKAKTTVTGLPALTTVVFRVSVTDNKVGQGPWTAAVPFLVH